MIHPEASLDECMEEISALEAEIERLRAALQDIADVPATLETKIDIARRALEPKSFKE